jgi:deoxyribodipyrimidine photo-lyase
MLNSSIVWFRQDLRLEDNTALSAAIERKAPVVPIFIWPSNEFEWMPGSASRRWLRSSLESLQNELSKIGLKLLFRVGQPDVVLQEIIRQSQASHLFWNRCYEPLAIQRDTQIKTLFKKEGIEVKSFNGSLLLEPWEIANKQGKPFQVFTPFWKAASQQIDLSVSLDLLQKAHTTDLKLVSEPLDVLNTGSEDFSVGSFWKPGEPHAKKVLKHFLEAAILSYPEMRDRPDLDLTSHLSPYLHFGEISPKSILREISKTYQNEPIVELFIRQLGWREFAHHLLYHFPQTPNHPLRENFNQFPWKYDEEFLKRWQQGQTGYPIVDAGMRQLLALGWMHNRVRMVVGSFLVKDLLLPWQEGAKWFWEKLLDADLANNTLGWQWVAGCGADAAPYFRIFNPVLQGEKFDPEGDYIKKWVPELAKLPKKWIHKPWLAPEELLNSLGVKLGKTYPNPIVDHSVASKAALAAFQNLRSI